MKKQTFFSLLISIFLLTVVSLAMGDIITVDDDGPADFSNIQAAIDAAFDGDEVVVADGTYTGVGNRDIQLTGKSITVRSENGPGNCTIDSNGTAAEHHRGFNFSNNLDVNSTIAGFAIINGYTTEYSSGINSQDNQSNSALTISNCNISNNTVEASGRGTNSLGGGISITDGIYLINNCLISNNSAYLSGGGIYSKNSDSVIIRNCIISNNSVHEFAGGISSDSDSVIIRNCTISNNTALNDHGGIESHNGMSDITNCILWGNSPSQIDDSSSVAVINYNCIEGSFVGGIGNFGSDPLLAPDGFHLQSGSPCINAGDPSGDYSGQTDIDGQWRVIGGCVDIGVDEFTATLDPTIEISPTEFEFYTAFGAANPDTQILTIQNIGLDTLNWEIIENCSWLEVDPNNGQSSREVNEVTISVDISGLDIGIHDCNLTISDPCASNSPQIVPVNLYITGPNIELSAMHFVLTAIEGGADPEDRTLSIGNSGLDTLNWKITENCDWLSVDPNMGSSTGEMNDVTLSTDTSGLDAGIYNCELLISDPIAENNPQTVAVTLCLRDSGGQLHVPAEYPTIQAAINAAANGDTVLVAEGTYKGTGNKNLDYGGKAITVRSINPNDEYVVAATIIDCENSGRGFYFHSGEDANSIVSGLTVKNGKIEGSFSSPDASGGGIYCSGASPKIINCHILDNSAYGWDCTNCGGQQAGEAYGGGISCVSGSHPTILDCQISGNLARAPETIEGWADAYGGGVFCSSDSTIAIYNSRITANKARGGKWMSDASFASSGCDSYGGGIYIGTSIGSNIKNCLITNNETVLVTGEDYDGINYGESQGAGIYSGGNTIISGCTFSGNFTDPAGIRGDGGGIYGPATVTNCIVWGNNLSNSQLLGATTVSYSDIAGGWSGAGTGNINQNPLFVTGPLGDYYLSQVAAGQGSNSPCVDAGSDTAAALGLDTYTTRTDKVRDSGTVDMGYHYSGNIADLNNSGHVDLGDFVILASQWQDVPGVPSADIAPGGGDGIVDMNDLAVLCKNYLW